MPKLWNKIDARRIVSPPVVDEEEEEMIPDA
jgi:hypothetical protein